MFQLVQDLLQASLIGWIEMVLQNKSVAEAYENGVDL